MGENGYLQHMQKNLWQEYELILSQEELYWFQKSRCEWIQFGDRKTRFYHTFTIVQWKRNKIEALLDQKGALEKLEKPLSNNGIRSTIFGMDSFKALGPDGLSPISFQANCPTVIVIMSIVGFKRFITLCWSLSQDVMHQPLCINFILSVFAIGKVKKFMPMIMWSLLRKFSIPCIRRREKVEVGFIDQFYKLILSYVSSTLVCKFFLMEYLLMNFHLLKELGKSYGIKLHFMFLLTQAILANILKFLCYMTGRKNRLMLICFIKSNVRVNSLSFADTCTLTKTIVTTLPTCTMQIVLLPKQNCRSYHTIAWNKFFLSKDVRDMYFCYLHLFNCALIMKLRKYEYIDHFIPSMHHIDHEFEVWRDELIDSLI
ncbi:hypothetical protein CR513_22958, partial [Mucuna pruriens]